MVNFGNIEVKGLYVGNAAAQRACLGNETVWGGEPPAPVEWWGLKFTAEQANSTVAMQALGTPPAVTLEYCDDGRTWKAFTPGETTVALAAVGDEVWLRAGAGGNSRFSAIASGWTNLYKFQLGGKVAASGSLMSLLDGTQPTYAMTGDNTYAFHYLFNGCTALTRAPELPATTIADECYQEMFWGCSNLSAAPALPATTLAGSCYFRMFMGCSKLSASPELPATTLAPYCYYSMFDGCTSLTSAPALPVTALRDSCYYGMFSGCSRISSAPELPATVPYPNCYANMFKGTSIATPPELCLTATAQACYDAMFQNCKQLTAAPVLSVTSLNGPYVYRNMFNGCTALSTPPELPATTLADSCYQNMFNGCTALSTPPELPATTLANYCYDGMFQNCRKLTAPPQELPAATAPNYAYRNMFNGCTALTAAPVMSALTAFSGSWNCFGMFQGCASLLAAPELNVTTLQANCFQQMFVNCSSLTAAPSRLPAATCPNGGYNNMFGGCVSLSSVNPGMISALTGFTGNGCLENIFHGCTALTCAPYLPPAAPGSRCYYYAFGGCSSLSSISVGLTSFGEDVDATTDWLSGTPANGDFYCPGSLGTNDTITRGNSACPTGWTVHNQTWMKYSDGGTSLDQVAGEIGRTDFQAIIQADGKTSADIYAVDFGQDVTAIAPSCFADWGALREVKIGDNVQKIGDNAFRRRNQISSVVWGSGSNLTAIGPYAFGGVQKVGQYDIPDGVLSIGNNAFVFGSVLSVVTLPQSVTSVGGSCFSNNNALLSVVFHGKTMADVQAMTNYPWGASGKIFVD